MPKKFSQVAQIFTQGPYDATAQVVLAYESASIQFFRVNILLYLPRLEHKLYVAINKHLEKLPPQLYYIKMKICHDQGCNDIGVVISTK